MLIPLPYDKNRLNDISVAGYNNLIPNGGHFKTQAEADAYSIAWYSNPANRDSPFNKPLIFPIKDDFLDTSTKKSNDRYDCGGRKKFSLFCK